MLILTNPHDQTIPKILKHLGNNTKIYVITELSIESIKNIPINELKVVYVKSGFNFSNDISDTEKREIIHFLHYLYKKQGIHFYGENFTADFSKEEYLYVAKNCGMDVPEYIYTNSKRELKSFVSANKQVITKSIKSQDKFYYSDNLSMLYGCYTQKLTADDIEALPGNFFPSFFQHFIEKDYELKIFYCDGKFYPGLLISTDKNNVDIRKDTEANPLPVKLDHRLETKLLNLILKLKLPICTIDIIHGIDGKYYFLEVNPSGQFGYISHGCNYNLEKIVAQKLLTHYQN